MQLDLCVTILGKLFSPYFLFIYISYHSTLALVFFDLFYHVNHSTRFRPFEEDEGEEAATQENTLEKHALVDSDTEEQHEEEMNEGSGTLSRQSSVRSASGR